MSGTDFLKRPLDDYVASLAVPTRVLRTGKRVGLVNARLMGANEAKGAVLTFLDAHCECTAGMTDFYVCYDVRKRKIKNDLGFDCRMAGTIARGDR